MKDISRREFGKQAAAVVGSSMLTSRFAAADKIPDNSRTPNIVCICSDQHSHRYNGFAGHPIVKTPNLDRIARQGVTFTNAYCVSPSCVPARTGMMTGMFPSDCNSFCNATVWDGSHAVFGTYLQEAGYYTRAIGKLDLNDDFSTGFEEIETRHGHRHNPAVTTLFRRPVAYRLGDRENVEGKSRENPHQDKRRTELAVRFLQHEAPAMKQPWMLYVGHLQPHPPFTGLKQYYDMYSAYNIDMPNVPSGHLEDLHFVFQELRHFKRIATPIPKSRIRRARAGYYAMITELDEYVGEVLNVLEKTNQLDNTIFIYTSDHGEMLGEHGLWYKNNLYENSVHIPLIISGPGIPGNMTIDTPVSHLDLTATILDFAGMSIPSKFRGHSLLPMIMGKTNTHPGIAYSECHSEGNCTGSFMIRRGDWKYIHFTWYDDLLFNLADDPGEFHNLIDNPSAVHIRDELRDILHSLVNPEAVTLQAFHTQKKMLDDMVSRMTEDELYDAFLRRMGPGLSRTLAAKLKNR